MKKIGAFLMAVIMLGGIFGCQKQQEPAPQQEAQQQETKTQLPYALDAYNLDAYMLPYWEGNTVYQEAVMVLKNADGTIDDIPLLYPAKEIVSVRTSNLKTEFQEGVDYALVDGKLRILEGSSVTTVEHSFYYPTTETENSMKLNKNYGEGYIYFSEGRAIHDMQIAVTYIHEGTFDGQIPAFKGDQLPKTMAKLQNGENLSIAVYGDSISTGANSTGKVNANPNAKPWFDMFAAKLREKYPNSYIALDNFSVGGKKSDWGVEEAAIRVGYGPDLCIIGFGMNDGSAKVPAEDYKQNIQAIMDVVLEANPNCEFVLIATMRANPEAGNFFGLQLEYLPVLLEMEKEGVVVADMTTFHGDLLQHKRYYDMTGNNVNHPNDFLARAYAQVMYQTVIGY